MKGKGKFVGFYHYGVILTYLSVAAAIAGMCLSVNGYPFYGGIICLWISGVCDAFDGAIASTRKNRTVEDRMFGEQIDSLSDIVAFGIAPVMIGVGMGMRQWYYIALFCIFVLCAVIRLAYYNVTEQIRLNEETVEKRRSFEGLPVTNVAVALPVFYLAATMFRGDLAFVQPIVMAVCYALLAFLFVFRFKMVKLGVKGLCVTVAVLVVLCVSMLLVNIYVFGGII